MGEQARDERGRFTSGGSPAHTAHAGRQAGSASSRAKGKAAEHDQAAKKHQGAAAAHREAAAKEPDPGRRSGHLAEAAKHDAHAAKHEAHAAAHKESAAHHEAHEHGGGFAHYLERAREGIEKRGEKANQLAEKALEENSIAGSGAASPHGMGR